MSILHSFPGGIHPHEGKGGKLDAALDAAGAVLEQCESLITKYENERDTAQRDYDYYKVK